MGIKYNNVKETLKVLGIKIPKAFYLFCIGELLTYWRRNLQLYYYVHLDVRTIFLISRKYFIRRLYIFKQKEIDKSIAERYRTTHGANMKLLWAFERHL